MTQSSATRTQAYRFMWDLCVHGASRESAGIETRCQNGRAQPSFFFLGERPPGSQRAAARHTAPLEQLLDGGYHREPQHNGDQFINAILDSARFGPIARLRR